MVYFQSSCSTQEDLKAQDSEIQMLNVAMFVWTKKECTYPQMLEVGKSTVEEMGEE